MIEYDQLEAAGNPIIPRTAEFSGERFEAFKQMATEGKKHGSLMVGQVSHPGRQCENKIQPNPISASDVQLQGNVMGMEFNSRLDARPIRWTNANKNQSHMLRARRKSTGLSMVLLMLLNT